MRRQAADISQRIDLDTQELEPRAVRQDDLEGNSSEPQETRLIGGSQEALDKCRFDLVQVQLASGLFLSTVRQMWRLPLRNRARGLGMVVSGPAVRLMGVIVTMVMVIMIVSVVMIVVLAVRVVMMVISMHGRPRQNFTGLLMIDLCEPSLPWATIEPSASTTTRTPISAVMSEVS